MSLATGNALTVVKQLRQKKYKTEVLKTLPASIPDARFLRMAATELARDPKLAKCSTQSLMDAVIEASHMGLCFDTVLGHAHIIPYGTEAKFQLGYKGYIVLAQRSGRVNHVDTQVVYEGDDFAYRFGTREHLDHTPTRDADKRGKMIGAWCKVTYPNGLTSFDFMPRADIETIRLAAPGSRRDASPWNQHTAEMYRKTVMIRHLKTRGLSPEITRYATAEEIYHSGSWQTDKQRAEEAREVKAEIVEQAKFAETMTNGQSIAPVESSSAPISNDKPTSEAPQTGAPTPEERAKLIAEHILLSGQLRRKRIAQDILKDMSDNTLTDAVESLRQEVAETAKDSGGHANADSEQSPFGE